MNIDAIKSLLTEHKERFLVKRSYVPRSLTSLLIKSLSQPEIMVITGIRRSGKSTLMKLVCQELLNDNAVPLANILYINFDDERFIQFDASDFEGIVEAYYELENPSGRLYFFLDEIQNVDGWERWLARLYERGDIKIFITGSNGALLAPEIATRLTGRHRHVVNWPFSFKEFLQFNNLVIEPRDFSRMEVKARLRAELDAYLQEGGFPEPLKQGDNSILQQYYQDILYRDIVARHQLRNISELKELALFLASNPATIHSYNSLRKMMGVKSNVTVKNYLEILEDAFLFFRMHLFDYSVKRQIYNPDKFYLIDTGLYHAISFRFSSNRGHLLENLVYLELRRRNQELYYWRSQNGLEVDFLIREGLAPVQAIQVCESLSTDRIGEREVRSLVACWNALQVPENVILSADDNAGEMEIDGCRILIKPIWAWLLEK